MKPSKTSQAELLQHWLDSLSPELRITWEFLTPAQRSAIFDEYQGLVAEAYAKPRKFAVMAFHEHNPMEVLKQPDQALIIGAGVKKLRGIKGQSASASTPKTA